MKCVENSPMYTRFQPIELLDTRPSELLLRNTGRDGYREENWNAVKF